MNTKGGDAVQNAHAHPETNLHAAVQHYREGVGVAEGEHVHAEAKCQHNPPGTRRIELEREESATRSWDEGTKRDANTYMHTHTQVTGVCGTVCER